MTLLHLRLLLLQLQAVLDAHRQVDVTIANRCSSGGGGSV
jgi:hypothetical protein